MKTWGAGMPQWLECRTHDWKVTGSNCCSCGGRILLFRMNFLCWLLFQYPFHPPCYCSSTWRSRSFCQKCRWQVTAKYAYTLRMWLCTKWHVTWCMVVWCTQNLRQDGSSFMWHHLCQRCKYTTSVDIKKRVIKCYSLMQNHMRAQWVCSRAENRPVYKRSTRVSRVSQFGLAVRR